MNKRKVCIVTGTRADYGLLKWVIEGVNNSTQLELQLIATGMHLSGEYGLTYKEIEADGFNIVRKINMLVSSDTAASISKSIALGMIGFSDALEQLKPDLVILLGDRFEILAAATTAMISAIPIAHIHGGEKTEGAFDEAIRHSITKMSQIHFVATEEYSKRVIQLGEDPQNVFNFGGLGVDCINNLKLLELDKLEESLSIRFKSKNLLITFHPVSLEEGSSKRYIEELLSALDELEETNLIFTMPNSDIENKVISQEINAFCKRKKDAYSFVSLGQKRYLSCVKYVDGVIGNSSSGILEVPTFKKGTINIGDRQLGRIRCASIIDCKNDRASILKAIKELYSDDFQSQLPNVKNPYGEGGASRKIVKTIEKLSLDSIIRKRFHDLN